MTPNFKSTRIYVQLRREDRFFLLYTHEKQKRQRSLLLPSSSHRYRNLFGSKMLLLHRIFACSIALDCFVQPTLSIAMMSTGVSAKQSADVVVVGGGPVGLATALTLSHPPHNCHVCIVESNAMVNYYDPTKAFLYNVNQRGQRLTKKFPRLHKKLIDSSIESRGMMSNFMVVPGDPNLPLPGIDANDSSSSSKMSEVVNPGIEATMKSTAAEEDDSKVSFWIPRHEMTRIMKEVVEEENEILKSKSDDNNSGSITVLFGMECMDVSPAVSTLHDDYGLQVVVKNSTTQQIYVYDCNLVVGADGYKSTVRNSLGRTNKTSENKFHSHKSWPEIPMSKFKVKQYKSPATGLRIKVLQLPPQFEINNVNGTTYKTKGSFIYAIRGVNKTPTTYLGLGLLPVKDNNAVRPANIITRPNHILWTLRTGEELKEWFSNCFPRLNFSKMVSQQEWDRLAQAEGTRFPHCQYSNGISLSSLDKRSGVVLVGDAIHSYPPDIGQGVNSGLLDVLVLGEALTNVHLSSSSRQQASIKSETSGDVSLGNALDKFEQNRLRETRALVHLARIGAPYQYNQPLRVDKFGKALWTTNLLLRTILNKVSFGVIPPAAIQLANQRPDLSFHQVMFRANLVTFGIGTVLSFLLKRIGLAFWHLIIKK